MSWIFMTILVLAWIPAILFGVNLMVYRALPLRRGVRGEALPGVSVLIPARNEEATLGGALDSVLKQAGIPFEVVVLDDHSTDRTAELVRVRQKRHSNLRLEVAPELPAGWCGKQHACHVLAGLARHRYWVYLDADVRLEAGALARMVEFLVSRGVALASGVPRQETETFLERLLIPLIHTVLLGYLPMPFMRWFRSAAFAAGCGQLFVVDGEAYRGCGGHDKLRNSLHDGLKLPRVFRLAGYRTDLFDATSVAVCRMYRSAGEVWHGLGKNAVEGLAHPARIVPMSLLLFGGQVLPFLVLPLWSWLGDADRAAAVAAVVGVLLPRLVGCGRFEQACSGALLHPVGVLLLLVIQWQALVRHWFGKPSEWKGRVYSSASESGSANA